MDDMNASAMDSEEMMDSGSATARRGSEVLMERYGRRPLEEAHLKQMVSMLDMDGVSVLDWFPYGLPATDRVYAKLRVNPKLAGTVIGRLLELEGIRIRDLDVFPYGLPRIDDLIIQGEFVAGFGG